MKGVAPSRIAIRLFVLVATLIAAIGARTAVAQTPPPYSIVPTGSTVGTAPFPLSAIFSPAGDFLAVVNAPPTTNPTGQCSISMFSVGNNGFLTPAPGSPFVDTECPYGIAFNRTGTQLASTKGGHSFTIYSVGADGALTIQHTISTTGEGTGPISVAFSPTSDRLAVAYAFASAVGIYDVSSAGTVTAQHIANLAAGASPQTVAFNAAGTLIATANATPSTVSVFSLAADGTPTAVGDYSSGAGTTPVSAAFSPDGKLLITANESTDNVTVFNVAANGALSIRQTAAASNTLPAKTHQATFHPSGKLVAIANPSASDSSGNVRLSAVDANGFLTPVQDIDPAFVASSVAFNARGDLLAIVERSLQSVFMYRVGPPKVTFTQPVEGSKLGPGPVGFPVKTVFSCSDAVYAPGIASCVDQDGNPTQTVLDTSALGPHTFSVTATSIDGQSTTSSVSFTIIAPPTATISSPASGGHYDVGQVVPTSFSCDSIADGPVVSVCQDSNGNDGGAFSQAHISGTGALKTSTSGAFTYTVSACAAGSGVGFCPGGVGQASITYTVGDFQLAPTTLSTPIVPANVLDGAALSATATLSRTDAQTTCVAGQPVTFTWTLPDGSTTTQAATTAANGAASVSFTPTQRGVHAVSASYAGGTCLQASASSGASTTAYQPMALTIAPLTLSCDAHISVSATLHYFSAAGPVAPGQSVLFAFSSDTDEGEPGSGSATTDANGVATFTVPCNSGGTYTADAYFDDADGFFTDHTGALPAAIENASAPLVLIAGTNLGLTAPVTSLSGNEVSVGLHLFQAVHGSLPIAGATVNVVVTDPNGGSVTSVATTKVNGTASVKFTPSLRGVYAISASYAGTPVHLAVTSTASLTVYQPATLTLAPITATAGVATFVTAGLTTNGGTVAVTGQVVTFDFGGAGPSQSATTDAGGNAAATVTFAQAGTFAVTASFSNAADFYTNAAGSIPPAPAVASASANVVAAQTALSNVTTSASGLTGNALTASAVLSRADGSGACLAGQSIVFSWLLPDGSTSSMTAPTVGEGTATVSFTPVQRGVHSVTAAFAGSSCLAPASSIAGSPVTVYQRTSIAVTPVTVVAGSAATVSATLRADGAPLAGQAVTFQYIDEGAPVVSVAVTNASGVASISPTFASPGTVTVTAAFFNFPGFFTNDVGAIPPQKTTGTGEITVTNRAPVAANDAYSTPANTPIVVAAPGVLSNDADADGQAITAVKLTNPAHGSVSFSTNGGFTYTPAPSYFGADSFTYAANDGITNGNTATVSFTVLSPAQVAAQVAAVLGAIDPRLVNDVNKVIDKKTGCKEAEKLVDTITKDKKYTAQQKAAMLAAVATLARAEGCSN